jgi:hypothetical protein|tara:strand:+ start:2466 stop:2687 length:222 start_codon:yes stop_codon:yes gene_type:complete
MANISYIGLDRINNPVQITGSLNVDGKFAEGGYSITALMEQMVVWDQGSDGSEDITILNFVPIITEDGESIVI